MMPNPFVEVYTDPVATLTAGAYALLLLSALVASWYAAGRNALYLIDNWQEGWIVLVPFWYTVRVIGMLVVAALDLLLIAGIIAVLA